MNTEHTNQSRQAEPATHSPIALQSIPKRQRDFTAENIRDIAHECMRIGDNEQAEVIFAIADALRDGNLIIQSPAQQQADTAQPLHAHLPAQRQAVATQLVCDALIAIVSHSGDPAGTVAALAEWRKKAEAFTRNPVAQQQVVAVPTIKLGLYGRAFDTPQTRRAYTYQHQPDNLDAYSLGRAAASTSPGGDNIDRGLSLLKELQAHGFGVFELGDQQEGGA